MAKKKPATTPDIPRREFLQLADKYKPDIKVKIAGWYVSEKLDGTRCFWDGGLTRDLATDKVPWASVTKPSTGKRKDKIKPRATGLWSRYGNPIMAPDWFLDLLPACPLDGELWAGRGQFELNRSIVAGDKPDPRFDQIQYAVYGCPPMNSVISSGLIKNANFLCNFVQAEFAKFVSACIETKRPDFVTLDETATFEHELLALAEKLDGDRIFLHRQVKLPNDEAAARAKVDEELNKYVELGAEGLVIRNPNAVWTPKRHRGLLKYKPFDDDEGRLVGFTSGRKTDKGSKHLGKIGALILDYNGKRLELSGLTDEEREFATPNMADHAVDFPGQDMPDYFQGKHFKKGQNITFLYRELSDDGIPKEARYFRKRDEE